jgi:hypothetical protein
MRTASGIVVFCALALALSGANAQDTCAEGRAANGNCVSPGLAFMTRQSSIIFSQPKISRTAFPVLPIQDLQYRYPNQVIPDPAKPAAAYSPSP